MTEEGDGEREKTHAAHRIAAIIQNLLDTGGVEIERMVCGG